MIPESGLPPEFEVSMSFATRELLRGAFNAARSDGRGADFVTALRTMLNRLQSNPIEFGEELFDLRSLNLTVKIAVVLPIVVEFGLYTERRLVFIRTFRYLPRQD